MVEMGICVVAACLGWHPAQSLGQAPDMRVDGKLLPAQAEHEHACHRLLSHALEPGECCIRNFQGLPV